MFKRDPQDHNYPDWTAITTGLPLGAPASLTIDSRDQSLLLGLAEAGVYKSTTRGASWINSDKGLNNTRIVGLALAPNASETAWATVGGETFHLAETVTGGDSWEYLPGSTIYLVWSQGRTGTETTGDFFFGNDLRNLFSIKPHNVFLVKFTYRFSL